MSRVRLVVMSMAVMSMAGMGLPVLPAAATEATTTRIEPRVFYGATVTLEEGVRVFRALPPHKQVIINPDSKAPVSLGFNETVEHKYNYYKAEPQAAPDAVAPMYGGSALPYGYYGYYGGKPSGPGYGSGQQRAGALPAGGFR